MAEISEVVNVTISRDSQAVSQASFGTAMFLGTNRFFTGVTQSFSSISEMITAGISTGSPEYLAAQRYFSADITPESFMIGRRSIDGDTVITPEPSTNGSNVVYSIDITDSAGVTDLGVSYTTTGNESSSVISAGWTSIINSSSAAVSAVDGVGFITITDDASGEYLIFNTTDNTTTSFTTDQSWALDITDVSNDNDSWYGMVSYTNDAADIESIASYIETVKKIYGFSTSDATDLTTATTGVGATLAALNYDRTFGIWSGASTTTDSQNNSNFPEAGWMGELFPKDPGSATWSFKTLSGILPDNLTSAQGTNARSNGLNTYESMGGVSITRYGTVASGEYLDIIRGSDWFESRLEERIYSLFVNNNKVPYTDSGTAMFHSEILAQILEGITNGFIDGAQDYTITIPRVADVSAVNKANREFPDIEFSAVLAGAINKTTLTGFLTL